MLKIRLWVPYAILAVLTFATLFVPALKEHSMVIITIDLVVLVIDGAAWLIKVWFYE